ncbi:MAG: ABC transporter permease [Chloroflexi bacterium]|nr:ABC transporter permease [Chloroflexota bacterium]
MNLSDVFVVLNIGLLAATLRMATPLIYAAIGAVVTERSGVMNIGIEGMMLFGAFTAVAGSYYTGNPWIGVLAAMVVGGLLGLLHAWASITLRADQIVSGVAINLLAVGVPNFLLIALWHQPGASPIVTGIPLVRVPLLADLPVVGQFFASQDLLAYGALAAVVIAQFVMFRTPFGIHLRSVGEHPRAADSVGLDVTRLRYYSVIFSGVMAGLGGAYLSIAELSVFTKQMTQGRGFIAMGAMIFGKWTPLGGFGACLLFGFADALQLALQTSGVPIPADLLISIPYVLTLVALAGFVGRAVAPAAIGKPYVKG